MNRYFFWLCLGMVVVPVLVQGQSASLRLSGLFTDHMVVQQEADVAFWGWALPGEEVRVWASWGTESVVVSDETGFWQTRIRSPKAGTSHFVEFSDGTTSITIADVAVGEVWVASGQSNMEMPLSGWPGNPILDSEGEIASAWNPDIRIMMVERAISSDLSHDVDGHWLPVSPESTPSMSATAYFFAKHLYMKLGVPIGVIHSSWGGTAVDSWIPVEELEHIREYERIGEMISVADTLTQNTPTVLFNAMIHPLIPFTIKGFLWYQGESDTGTPAAYHKKFTTMIRTWRERWEQGDISFYFVQIAPYTYGDQTESYKIREAQLESLTVPNTGMVVTLDIGDPDNIHPANKQEVGRRLSLWAAAHSYNRDVEYSGPLFESMDVDGAELLIRFLHTGDGLVAGPDGVQHVMIAGSDQIFYPAKVTLEPHRIRVSHPAVNTPAAVRYLWDNHSEASLFNAAGLPASSFRTDRWD